MKLLERIKAWRDSKRDDAPPKPYIESAEQMHYPWPPESVSIGYDCTLPEAEQVEQLNRRDRRMGTFQVFQDKSGDWRWRLRAANSRVIAQSESYTRKYDAVRAVQAIDRALKSGYLVDLPE